MVTSWRLCVRGGGGGGCNKLGVSEKICIALTLSPPGSSVWSGKG